MQRRFFQFAILLTWLALPLVALEYRDAWSQLPARLATHFNAAGQPNGWMSSDQAMQFSLWMVAIVLAVTTIVLVIASWRTVEIFTWALLGFCVLIITFFVEVNQSILNYNLHQTPVHPEKMLILLPVAAIALIVIYIGSHRQAPLDHGDTLAVETHTGRGWSAVIILGLLAPAISVAMVPQAPARFALILVALIGAAAFAMTWAGFRYRFQRHGLEISTAGLRLRSIPRSAVESYSIQPWPFSRGYGIRGLGASRAYVWGGKVVHIKLSNGNEVYLGHKDPERIVRDLDQMMGS